MLKFKDGSYHTAKRKIGVFSRAFPSIKFYIDIIGIVVRAGRNAAKGGYSMAAWHGDSLATLRALERVGVRIEITGVENFMSAEGPCVFASNHMSTLETFFLPVIIGPLKEVTFVVKESLLKYPFFGDVLRAVNPIKVGRRNPREDLKTVLEEGEAKLKEGISLIVFPQSSRSVSFDPEDFNTLAVKLARRAGVPVVPVAIKSDAWGTGRVLRDFGRIEPARKVYISFGPPLEVKDRGAGEHKAVIGFISEKLKGWQEAG